MIMLALSEQLRSPNLVYVVKVTYILSPKRGLQYQPNLLLVEAQVDIYGLPFVQNKDYQYSVSHLDTLK